MLITSENRIEKPERFAIFLLNKEMKTVQNKFKNIQKHSTLFK